MLFDPNYPGDENYVTYDTNTTTTILMDADREVIVAWRCGSGLEALPLLVAMGVMLGVASHRKRRT